MKIADPKGSVGSNPTLSALFNKRRIIIKYRDAVLKDSDDNKFIRRYFSNTEYKDYPISTNTNIEITINDIDVVDIDDDNNILRTI